MGKRLAPLDWESSVSEFTEDVLSCICLMWNSEMVTICEIIIMNNQEIINLSFISDCYFDRYLLNIRSEMMLFVYNFKKIL